MEPQIAVDVCALRGDNPSVVGICALRGDTSPIGQGSVLVAVSHWTGLKSAPSTFCRMVDAMLAGLPPNIAFPYVDDLLIATDGTFEDHMRPCYI